MGRYRLGRRLGAGGFGAVHEALDERLDRWVAVKVIPVEAKPVASRRRDQWATPVRARREAVAAARLEHPGIVAIYDAGEADGARYLVSELVEGRTLAQLEADGELTDRDVLRVGLALCDALEHAHERGVVHRDVKPPNVLVPDRPKTWRGVAKLADFGVAMLAGDDPLTMTGDVVGTLAYMAPEQAEAKRVDARADLYALALVLYEALAGVNPVRGASPAETARRVGKPVPSLAGHRRDLPAELVAALDRALRTAPAERGTLEDLGDALEGALVAIADEGGAVARHPSERVAWLTGVPRGAPRVAHGLATAALVAGALGWLGPSARVPWLAAAGVAFALTVLLPRTGWLLAGLGTVAALIAGPVAFAPAAGVAAAGTALTLLIAVLPVPALLLRAGRAWSVPVLAPALGVIGLAGAFPALAGRAATAAQRAALGALGAWWVLLAEPLAHRTLELGPARGVPVGADAQEAVSIAASAVAGTVTGGLVALLAVWAIAATVLPWIVRGRSLALDVVVAAAWAAGLASATATLATGLGDAVAVAEPKGLVAGAVVAGIVAVVEPRYSPRDLEDA